MTIKELEKEYNKKIKALKRSLNYYEKQGRDTSALRDLIKEYTKDSNIRTKTGRIKIQVLRDLESVRAQSLIDRDKKQQERKKQMKERGEENRRQEKIKKDMQRKRQNQINKQKAKIRMSIETKIESTLNKIKEADPHTDAGQPLYNKIKQIYTSYTDVKTKDIIIDKIIRNLQQQFGEEGLKKGYRIWGQYGLKKIEEAYIQMERYSLLDSDTKATISKMPLPIVKECYETVFCESKKDAYKEDWESGQVYFVHLLTVKKEKMKRSDKTRTVEVYAQSSYLKNVEAIKYLTIKGKDSSESYDATRDYDEVVKLLGTFYI